LSGAVLELGCGGGRLTGHLVAIARELTAMDIAPNMVEYCQKQYPEANFAVGDIADLSGYATASSDVVVAGFNLIDVLDDVARQRFFDDIHRILTPDGILLFSSHNLACVPIVKGPLGWWLVNPLQAAIAVRSLPRSLRNHRRLRPLQRFESDYAIVNDSAVAYSLLHYYISRDGQEAQLKAHGFELLECLDLAGAPVERGGDAPRCHELHYAARRVETDPPGDERSSAASRS
jgi:SAM-dependent methyltransferase